MKFSDITTREEAIAWAKDQKQTQYLSLIKRIPESVKVASGTARLRPKKAAVGDIFFIVGLNHPFIAISKNSGVDEFWCAGLSTKEAHSIGKLVSRWEGESYITTALTKATGETIRQNYRGSVSSQEVRRIKSLIKPHLPKL